MKRTLLGSVSDLGRDSALLGSGRGQLVIVLAVVVLTAGCLGAIGDGESQDIEDASTIDSIPADVDGVAHLDSDIVSDQATTELMDGLMELFEDEVEDEDAPSDWDGVLEEIEDETELEIGDFHAATVFFELDDDTDAEVDDAMEEYAGVIIESDWEWEQLVEAADEEIEDEYIDSETYNAVPLYSVAGEDEKALWVADFQDGTFAAGNEDAVKDVIDTRQGDIEPFDGDLRDAYENLGDSHVKAAMMIPEDFDEDDGDATDADFGDDFGDDLELMTMRYGTEGSEMQFDVGLTFETAESAEDITHLIGVADMFVTEEEFGELATVVENIEADQDDTHVTISYTTTTEEVLGLFEFFEEWEPFEEEMGDAEFTVDESQAIAG